MADLNNFTEITKNFDTIKTLLNSIRAQGILNTSDVDKLLAGINSKLEKLDTEEDIDLIKVFLSELKQNLEERHNVLLSKFGAIEALFSNLLKNSTETVKSGEVKELFDIVATNLSVFSREVVSQKEALTDITLRLDAMRSDDTQKKDIIKNIGSVKSDIERLSNGFDSIVLSLNDNFTTIIKTITSIDPSENINKFGKELEDIVNSSNTILSAVQMLDKKNLQIEDLLKGLATKDDLNSTKQWINDLAAQEQALAQSIDNLNDKYYKIDNLADKIDASVDIIAGLKTIISDKDEQSYGAVLDRLSELETTVREVSTNQAFENFKESLEAALKGLFEGSSAIKEAVIDSSAELERVNDALRALDINVSFKSLAADLNKSEQNVREHISVETDKVLQLVDVNATRTLNEISSSADNLTEHINQAHSLISSLCEKSFSEVEENIAGLKNIVSQIDENNVSANNAIFSNITDRLTLFENNLKVSLEKQEDYVSNSSSQLVEQINSLKDLSNLLDYKIDASVIEVNNAKTEFTGLKSAVEAVLALDFVNIVKDLKVDLYAVKQDLADAVETSTGDLAEKFSNDLFGKYELLISKLDNVETEIKQAQAASLKTLKEVLDNISSSIVDVLSYVSSRQDVSIDSIEAKIETINRVVNDNTLSYVENVRDIVDVIRTQVENNIKNIQEDTNKQIDRINNSISTSSQNIREEIQNSYNKLIEVQENFDRIRETLSANNNVLTDNINGVLSTANTLRTDFDTKLSALKNAILDKVAEFQQDFTCENADKISEIKFVSENLHSQSIQNAKDMKAELQGEISRLIGALRLNVEGLTEELAGTVTDFLGTVDTRIGDMNSKFGNMEEAVNILTDKTTYSLSSTLAKILDNFVSLKALLGSLNDKTANDLKKSVDIITNDFAKLRDKVDSVDANIDDDLTRQLALLETNFEMLNQSITNLFTQNDALLGEKLNTGLAAISNGIRETVVKNLEQYRGQVENLFNNISGRNEVQANFIGEKVLELNNILQNSLAQQNAQSESILREIAGNLKRILDENIEVTSSEYNAIKNKLMAFANSLEEKNNALSKNLKSQLNEMSSKMVDFQASFETLSERLEKEEIARMNIFQSQINELGHTFNVLIDETKDVTKSEVSAISETLIANSKTAMEEVEQSIDDKVNSILVSSADIAAGELQSMEMFADRILEQIDINKQATLACRDFVTNYVRGELNIISENIEKETDVIVKDLIEQMNIMREFEKDEFSKLTIHIESSVEDYIYEHISDLKSYIDVKSDTSGLSSKIDSIVTDLGRSAEDMLSVSNKLLKASVFEDAMSDMKIANEILVSTMAENLNSQLQHFITSNISQNISDKFNLFDKKFTDTVVDKYEEIKLISTKYNNAFVEIEAALQDLLSKFVVSKDEINHTIISVLKGINGNLDELGHSFADLKAQILNKEFDEAFQHSVNNQIQGIENLIREQFGYLEDITDLCGNNLPELTEMNAIIKHSVLQSIEGFNSKLETQGTSLQNELNNLKTDIITQFLNIFNQISFVAEQEEILDFIQEKHSELITVLSHIVTTMDDVSTAKNNIAIVDKKVDTLKADIDSINEKITSIISSDGDIDYIYSLQDLEGDIANLRLSLNEIKQDNKSKELEELIKSTNDIYELVDSIKKELPNFKIDEFRKDFDALNEDIVSISTRTNKLILASDESYKTLQENLHDFKLVINDLDERTRNFAHEAGLDKIDNKLGAINTMIQNGAKTNQVFNQVFEYLAEWVDNAGAQITSISDKVETLDDIGQIKVMLEDLKANAEDDSESAELIEALGNIFDKQAKKIASLEAKLDRVIVETTISNKNNKIDMSPLEDTLNRFLVAIDDRMSSQQDKINSLESKLEDVATMFDPKDTAQLTKKVGGMDRQIAKLNKSIEKIASHVIEK